MPFNTNIPADGTKPWGGAFRTAWNALTTFINGLETSIASKASAADLSSGLAGKVNTGTYTSGMANKADLVGGVIPTAQLPAIAISEYLGQVASESAMLALVGQRGDWATRSDNSTTWILIADDATKIASWAQVLAPSGDGGAVVSVAGKTGVVSLVKADVGLSNVDNTSDANKPVSSAQQTALDGKVPMTRTVAGKPLSANVTLAKGDVGLGNVDNTSDASKPVSTAQQAALDAKVSTSGVAGLNTVGWGRAVFIPKGGTVPANTPEYTIVIEKDA